MELYLFQSCSQSVVELEAIACWWVVQFIVINFVPFRLEWSKNFVPAYKLEQLSPLFHLGSNFNLFWWVVSFGSFGLFRSILVEMQDSACMSWSYGSEYRERKREVLRYEYDVRECLCDIERKQKGKTSLIHTYLLLESRKKRQPAEGIVPLLQRLERQL